MSSSLSFSPKNSATMAWIHFVASLFLFITLPINLVSSSATRVSYTDHCGSIVTGSALKRVELSTFPFLQLDTGRYTGGNKLFDRESYLSSNSLFFSGWNVFKTEQDGVFKVQAKLGLQTLNEYVHTVNFSYARPYYHAASVSFSLDGLWSESSGELCMVGSGSRYIRESRYSRIIHLDALLKLYGIKNSTNVTSLITGTLKSLSNSEDENHFESISILFLPRKNYEYTMVSGEGCPSRNDTAKGLPIHSLPRKSFCSITFRRVSFNLKYANDCNSTKKCSPLDGIVGYLPSDMFLKRMDCSENEKKMRVMIAFGNGTNRGFYPHFNFNTTLVGEGSWDEKNNQLCLVACKFLGITESFANAHVGECSTRLSLKFPAIWSIRDTSSILGQIWSNKTVNESGYFRRIAFLGSGNRMFGVPGVKYEYTEIDKVQNLCTSKKPTKNKGERYPSGDSYDMRFDMWVKSSKKTVASGYADPISVGDQFYERNYEVVLSDLGNAPSASVVQANWTNPSPVNISYKIGITPQIGIKLGGLPSLSNTSSNSNGRGEIMAEGIYDGKSGRLCMVGCRKFGSNHQIGSMDCEILVKFQFPPLNSRRNGGYIEGTIESTRKNSDPLYFKRFELSSMVYGVVEAKRSVQRMDMEIIMVLISNTLACIVVVLQLFHVKRHPEALPCISLVMLVILTLGHMIPLLLNFEAMFLENHDRKTGVLHSGGWLEVNEVILRGVTMVAFLLQARLVQLTWSSRSGDGNFNDLWFFEKSTVIVSLPFYAAGALIAWLVNWRKSQNDVVMLSSRLMGYHQKSLWMDLKSYGGLVLDCFLLPQILLNIFRSSKENALSHSFYIGYTFVRLLPHVYDLYRSHIYNPDSDGSYYYAKPGADFYSTAWDIIIPLVCMLFAAILYLQQLIGGRCIIPPKFRQLEAYENVPVASEADCH